MSNLKITSSKILEARDTALNLIVFIVSDEDRIERFCALSGLGEQELKDRLSDDAFLGFVFDYAMQDEAMLRDFASQNALNPEKFAALRRALPGATDDF